MHTPDYFTLLFHVAGRPRPRLVRIFSGCRTKMEDLDYRFGARRFERSLSVWKPVDTYPKLDKVELQLVDQTSLSSWLRPRDQFSQFVPSQEMNINHDLRLPFCFLYALRLRSVRYLMNVRLSIPMA
jgi:hypothetical protein